MNDQLLDLLREQIGDEATISRLSEQLGGVDKDKTKVATEGILSTLVAGLAKNAASPEGAKSLDQALERDHDGSILEDFLGSITGQRSLSNTNALNGSGILRHVLGGKQTGAADMVGQMSGLGKGKTLELMTMLAPLVMAALGKMKRSQGLDPGGLASILTQSFNNQRRQSDNSQAVDMISSFLDSDGDGDITDDLGKLGKGLLGGLFGR